MYLVFESVFQGLRTQGVCHFKEIMRPTHISFDNNKIRIAGRPESIIGLNIPRDNHELFTKYLECQDVLRAQR
jgi:hypothetical protein